MNLIEENITMSTSEEQVNVDFSSEELMKIARFYKVSSSRHLKLNHLLFEHFVQEKLNNKK